MTFKELRTKLNDVFRTLEDDLCMENVSEAVEDTEQASIINDYLDEAYAAVRNAIYALEE